MSNFYLKPAVKVILPDGTHHLFEWRPPQDMSTSSPSESINMSLFGDKGLCRGNYFNDLKVTSSWVTQVGAKSNDRCPYKKQQKSRHTEDAMCRGRQRLEGCCRTSGNAARHQGWKGWEGGFYRACRRSAALRYLDLGLLASRTDREQIPVVLPSW